MAPDADFPTPDSEDETPPSRRRGIGLCLSGGGFRATLFHAGAIQRLFELGIATRPDFDTVASVSGGSLTAAQWAVATSLRAGNRNAAGEAILGTTPSLRAGSRDAAGEAILGLGFTRDIARPLQALTSKDIRTGAMAKRFLLPWNWFRGSYAVNEMIEKFEAAFGKGTLNLLPDHPRFVFCATDMAFGASFIFDRDRVGSYLAGYAPPEGFTLAQAVAASACFPPLFGPMRIDRAAERFKGVRAPSVSADARRKILEDLRVTDGGVYDNMGLEPVWKSHRVVLVSDAGCLMDAEADNSWTWRIKRYQSIQECQARGVRKRFLISGFTQGTIKGASQDAVIARRPSVGGRRSNLSIVPACDGPLRRRPRARLLKGVRDGSHRQHPHRPRRVLRGGAGCVDESRVRADRRRDSDARAGVDRERRRGVRAAVPTIRPAHDDGGRTPEGARRFRKEKTHRSRLSMPLPRRYDPAQLTGLSIK